MCPPPSGQSPGPPRGPPAQAPPTPSPSSPPCSLCFSRTDLLTVPPPHQAQCCPRTFAYAVSSAQKTLFLQIPTQLALPALCCRSLPKAFLIFTLRPPAPWKWHQHTAPFAPWFTPLVCLVACWGSAHKLKAHVWSVPREALVCTVGQVGCWEILLTGMARPWAQLPY